MSTYQYRSNAGRLYKIECDLHPQAGKTNWRWMADDDAGMDGATLGSSACYWACVDQIEERENDAR